jgi:hypothetical protein
MGAVATLTPLANLAPLATQGPLGKVGQATGCPPKGGSGLLHPARHGKVLGQSPDR